MKIKKILVTGSSGTIGTRLCEILLEKGYNVVGVDKVNNKYNDEVNKVTIVCNLLGNIDKLPSDIDLIIHLAANARVYDLVVDPLQAMENIQMTFNVLEFARKNNIKKVMFSSSRETYGNSNKKTYIESDVKIENCESPYSASKISGEVLFHSYQKCYDIDFVIFRFSNVYGMYDDSDRVIPLFIRLAKQNKDLVVFGKDKLLDFTYIDDLVKGIINTIKRFNKVKNDVYNLAYGEGVTILKVAKLIRNNLKSHSEIVIDNNRTGEVVKYIAITKKAKNMLDWNPKIDIEKGVEKTV